MKVIKEDDKIKVQSDYNSDFVKRAKLIEGKWNAPYWVFPDENEDKVRALLLEIYGENGLPQETVDIFVDISCSSYDLHDGSDIKLLGRILCFRPGRDMQVKLADNVLLEKGGFPSSGGSARYPRVLPEEGTILRVKKCPLSFYERVKDMSIVTLCEPSDDNVKRSRLLEEKEKLLKRLDEIETELANMDKTDNA